jgi:hypothetical protein
MIPSDFRTLPMSFPRLLPFALLFPSAALAGDSKAATVTRGNWEFSLSAGPAWRQSGTLGFTGGSRSGGLLIPSFVGENSLFAPPIGDAAAIGNRQYNDGFVRLDGSTAIDGYTTYWGYQNAGQVSGDNLTFQATGFQSIRSDSLIRGNAPSFSRREQTIAPVIQFDGRFAGEFAGIRPGFSASLTWSPVELDRVWSDFSLTQTRDDFRHDWTDTYNLGGFGPQIPSAPYSGSAAGPGFTLENIPDSRGFQSVLIGSDSALFENTVATRFRADHTAFSFGPTIQRAVDPSWSIDAGAGISLNWLHWSAAQGERLARTQAAVTTTHQRWDDASSGDKLVAGLYFQVGAEWTPPGQEWSLKGFLRTDIGGSFSKQVGPSRITYDTDGFTAAFLISHPL